MILEVLVAAMVGVMFANTWLCVLMSLGCAAEGEVASRYFLVGRFFGVVALGTAISALRIFLQDRMQYVILVFGIFSFVFAGIVLGRQYLERRMARRMAEGEKGCSSCAHSCETGGNLAVDGNKGQEQSLFWSKCNCGIFSPIGSSCEHEECGAWEQADVGTSTEKKVKFGRRYGLALGLFRGVTPCAKIVLLAPLVISVEFYLSLIIIVVYAATSSVYPLIGLMSAKLINKVKGYKTLIRVTGALIMIGIGIYSVAKYLTWDVNQPH